MRLICNVSSSSLFETSMAAAALENTCSGYDVTVVGEYAPNLVCGICHMLINQAMHGCNSHAFCKECIKRYIENYMRENVEIRVGGSVVCPGGCGKYIDEHDLKSSEILDLMIKALQVQCCNENCPWRGDLYNHEEVHRRECDFKRIKCSNEGCEVEYCLRVADQHVCLYVYVTCEHCQNGVLLVNKKEHEEKCISEQIDCYYSDIGCTKQACRKDMVSHETVYQNKHMKLMYAEISSLREENTALKAEISEVKMKTTYISLLKEQLKSVPGLSDRISLINQDSVVYARCNVKWYRKLSINKNYISINSLARCYENNLFDYVIEQLYLSSHKTFCQNLLNYVPFHLFEFKYGVSCSRFLCFPCFAYAFTRSEEMSITIPDVIKVSITGNELMVETYEGDGKPLKLLIGKKEGTIENGTKVDLRKLPALDNGLFTHGYACIGF